MFLWNSPYHFICASTDSLDRLQENLDEQVSYLTLSQRSSMDDISGERVVIPFVFQRRFSQSREMWKGIDCPAEIRNVRLPEEGAIPQALQPDYCRGYCSDCPEYVEDEIAHCIQWSPKTSY